MHSPFPTGLRRIFGVDLITRVLSGAFLLFSCDRAAARAEETAPPADLRAVIAGLIRESDHNFDQYKGEKAAADENSVYYKAKPIPDMVAGAHYVGFIKGYYFYVGDFTAAASRKAIDDAIVALPGFKDERGAYTLVSDQVASTEKKQVTNVLLNGRWVVTYAKFPTEAESTITVGPFKGRTDAENQAAAGDGKTKAFTAGTQILVRAAAGNFPGMTKDLMRKTGDGDPMYWAARVPEMQTQDDGQVIMVTENRNFYMNSYDTEAEVAFAYAAFLALPKNIAQDQAYAVELDQRLEKPSSTTYHLRYNGQIVGDFIKFKLKPKAYFTIGYRDGIPKGLVMGRTYSDAAIAGAKQMINEATTCTGCHGTGVEEIDTGWESKSTGIHEKKWVPCHYCHGTGHL